MNDGERTVPGQLRPAGVAASKARQQTLDAAVLAQQSRRPKAEPGELALPLISAVNYLVDAVMDLQGQIVQLEALALANVSATQATSTAMLDLADGNQEVHKALLGALEGLAGVKP